MHSLIFPRFSTEVVYTSCLCPRALSHEDHAFGVIVQLILTLPLRSQCQCDTAPDVEILHVWLYARRELLQCRGCVCPAEYSLSLFHISSMDSMWNQHLIVNHHQCIWDTASLRTCKREMTQRTSYVQPRKVLVEFVHSCMILLAQWNRQFHRIQD